MRKFTTLVALNCGTATSDRAAGGEVVDISFDWIRQPHGATPEQFEAVERLFGVSLPADYREFATVTAGGMPADMTDFEFVQQNGNPLHGCIGTFMSLESEGNYSIRVKTALLGDWLPKKLVPVIEDPAGSFLCLDYSKSDSPCVSFWRHDRKGYDNELSVVAPSFSAFLTMLHDPDPSEDDEA